VWKKNTEKREVILQVEEMLGMIHAWFKGGNVDKIKSCAC
jgi:hypothetical protein